MIVRYSTYAEFLKAAIASDDAVERSGLGGGKNWYGGHTFKQAVDAATNGDESLVANAQLLLDQLESVDYGERTTEWAPSVSGAYPVVPEFLAGHPLCMREPRETENLAPVSIYVCTTVSMGLNADQIMRRGTAILALVLKLQTIRSVDLYVTSEVYGRTDGDYIQVIPIESKPLSVAHASNALTGTSFTRHLTYGVAIVADGFQGAWGKHPSHTNSAWIEKQLGISDTDLYIKSGHSDDELINSPVEWINTQLERFNAR